MQCWFFLSVLKCKFPLEDIDWDIRLKQCATSYTIDLIYTTHVLKFSSLASLSIILKSYNQRHYFFMKIKKWVIYKNISNFDVEVDIINESKRVSRMWENAYLSIKTQKLPGPLSGPWTLAADTACFAHMTLLHYISKFWPQKAAPLPPWPNPGSTPGMMRVLLISLHIRSMWETTVMHKYVCSRTVNFGPDLIEAKV